MSLTANDTWFPLTNGSFECKCTYNLMYVREEHRGEYVFVLHFCVCSINSIYCSLFMMTRISINDKLATIYDIPWRSLYIFFVVLGILIGSIDFIGRCWRLTYILWFLTYLITNTTLRLDHENLYGWIYALDPLLFLILI